MPRGNSNAVHLYTILDYLLSFKSNLELQFVAIETQVDDVVGALPALSQQCQQFLEPVSYPHLTLPTLYSV